MSSLPNVLLLGDSIRMSYQSGVADLLAGHATVTGPTDNCQYSLYTLSSLDRWINALGKPDIVHWNNGLHDCGHNPGRNPIQIPVDMYGANLSFILGRLKFLTPNVIWATSTPVHPDRPFSDSEWSWRNDEIDAYNSAARQVMNGENVQINDLHTLVKSNPSTYLSDDQLHLSSAGQAACASSVAEHVSACIT